MITSPPLAHQADSDRGLQELRSPPAVKLHPAARLRRLAALESADIWVIVVYAVAIGLVSLAVPIASQALVTTVAFTSLLQPLGVLSGFVLVGLVAAGILRSLQYQVVEILQERFFVRLTHEAAVQLTNAELPERTRQAPVELMNRFFEVATVQKTAAALLMDGVSIVLQATVSLVLLAFYHPALLAFDVVLIALIAFVLVVLGRGGVQTAVTESKAKYATASWLEEVASAPRIFRSPEGRRYAFGRADALAASYLAYRREHFRVLFRQVAATYALQALATAALLGLGGSLVLAGQLSLGQLVAAELIVTGVLTSFAKLGKYLESYYDLAASIDKVGAIIDLPRERNDGLALPASTSPIHARLENVAFAHAGAKPTVAGVSFDLPPGGRVAVLGEDASGKSTLVDLVRGGLRPTAGRVSLDGMDVSSLTASSLEAAVVVVREEAVLDASVLENLTLGGREAGVVSVDRALEVAALEDEVRALPEGLATVLGAGGVTLSPSQATRLSIARALLRAPRLLILDAVLDGLGAETVTTILAALESLRETTSLLVLTRNAAVAEGVGPIVRLPRRVRTEADA